MVPLLVSPLLESRAMQMLRDLACSCLALFYMAWVLIAGPSATWASSKECQQLYGGVQGWCIKTKNCGISFCGLVGGRCEGCVQAFPTYETCENNGGNQYDCVQSTGTTYCGSTRWGHPSTSGSCHNRCASPATPGLTHYVSQEFLGELVVGIRHPRLP
jgi:hypothetical protein